MPWESGDIVVFDRGYFSFELLHDVIATGAHPVFRLKSDSAGAFRTFMEGDGAETTVSAAPGPDTRRELAKRRPGETFGPAGVRLVRCGTDAGAYDLATTLPATGHVSAADLADLYHGRWSIEELARSRNRPSRWMSSTAGPNAASARSSSRISTLSP